MDEATGVVKDTYLEIESGLGKVPNLFKTLAHKSDLLRGTWMRMNAIMKDDLLPRKVKMLVALRVSALNGADYCVNAHYNGLKNLGYNVESLERVKAGDYELLAPVEGKILTFVDKATNNYGELEDSDFEGLGMEEEEILELTSVIDLFSGLNRLTEILDIPLD